MSQEAKILPGEKGIVFTVGDGGKITTEAIGFKGKSCRVAAKPYEDALGLTDQTVTEKPEINEVEQRPVGAPRVGAS